MGAGAGAGDGDAVQRAVELAVPAAVEPHAFGAPRGGGDRVGPTESRKGGLRAQSLRIVARAHQQGGCTVGLDAEDLE